MATFAELQAAPEQSTPPRRGAYIPESNLRAIADISNLHNDDDIKAEIQKTEAKLAAEKAKPVHFADLVGAQTVPTEPKPVVTKPKDEPWSASRLGANAAAVGDLVWGVVPMAGGQFLDSVERTKEFMKAIPYMRSGEDIDAAWKAAGMKGRLEARHMNELMGQPFQKAMAYFGADKNYDESSVNKAMTKLSGWLDKGTDYVVEKSGGAISKDDAETIRDDLMLVAPVGFGKLAGRVFKKGVNAKITDADAIKVLEREAPKPTAQQIEANVGPDAPPPPFTLREVNLPEQPPPRPPKPPEAQIGEQVGEVPKTRMAEGQVIGGEELPPVAKPIVTGTLDSIDTGLAKLREGKAWDMTAEERIAVRNQGPRPNIATQGGKADVELLGKIATVGGGALAASSLVDDDKFEAALAGGLVGLAPWSAPRYAKAVASNFKRTMANTVGVGAVTAGLTAINEDHPIEGALFGLLYGASKALPKSKVNITKVNNLTLDDMNNMYFGAQRAEARQIGNVSDAIRQLVPDKVRRAEMATEIEGGNFVGRNANETAAGQAFRNLMDTYGQTALREGIIKGFIDNYVTHIVEKEGLPRSKIQQTLDAIFGNEQSGIGSGARFGKERKFATFQDLDAAIQGTGLKVKTRDIADIVDLYGRSMSRAIETQRYIDGLKAAYENPIIPNAHPFIMDIGSAPKDYSTINHPQMRGLAVHPELLEPLRFALEKSEPSSVVAGLHSLAIAQKRIATGLSLFHGMNLLNAYVGATGLDFMKGTKPINAAIRAYKTGPAGDAIHLGLENGLVVEHPMDYQPHALEKIGEFADGVVEKAVGVNPRVGKFALGGIEKLQTQFFDKITWDYLQTGLKLATYLKEFEKARLKNPNMAPKEVARQVASYVNDTFGGLDWYRVATETQSGLTRQAALSAFSPKGRRVLQIGMFAPDWTISTFRAMYKALPGATDMPITARLHQKYVARTAVLYLTAMNGYNMAVNDGKPIWENKNPWMIEYPDGTRQQVAKHAMEGPEWTHHPRQVALNKMSFVPKLPFELATQKEYLSADNRAPAIESNIGHIAGQFAPITAAGFTSVPSRTMEDRVKRAALSATSFPIYGLSKEERAAEKTRRKLIRDAKKARDKEKGK